MLNELLIKVAVKSSAKPLRIFYFAFTYSIYIAYNSHTKYQSKTFIPIF